ncbi:MAG TPA: TIGR03000 domain-containing protein [Gemmataceae bacterium]
MRRAHTLLTAFGLAAALTAAGEARGQFHHGFHPRPGFHGFHPRPVFIRGGFGTTFLPTGPGQLSTSSQAAIILQQGHRPVHLFPRTFGTPFFGYPYFVGGFGYYGGYYPDPFAAPLYPPQPPAVQRPPALPERSPSNPLTPPTSVTPGDDRASLTLRVPPAAEVWIDGEPMADQTGAVRQFVTPPLDPGKTYTYEVRVRWMAGDQPREQVRTITFRAGDEKSLMILAPGAG